MTSRFFNCSTAFFVLLVTLLSACATKEKTIAIQRSGNRKVGLMIQKIDVGGVRSENPEFRLYFNDLLSKTITEIYGSDIQLMNIADGNLLESPDSLFLLASNEIDDLFLAEIKLPQDFTVPVDNAEVEGQTSKADQAVLNQTKRIEITSRILNGANLRPVTILNTSTAWGLKSEMEKDFREKFKENALQVFSNPNIYPKSDPAHFANLLFQFSERRERENLAILTCENAAEVLSSYVQARDLYQKAKDRGPSAEIGQTGIAQDLNSRLEESSRRASVLKTCEDDKTRGFSIDSTFLNIDPANQSLIKQAMQNSKLDELLKQYTDKPVKLSFTSIENGEMDLQVFLRFDRNRFLGWTKKKGTPSDFLNFNILSLDPYYPILQTLIYLRQALPKQSPQSLNLPFQKMNMSLVLETLLNGELFISANGRISKEASQIELFYPNSVLIKIPSYESSTVITRSEDVFQDKGWIALSSCKTVQGTVTQDGLVMQFFGLPCKI